jgi:hypothetical protein
MKDSPTDNISNIITVLYPPNLTSIALAVFILQAKNRIQMIFLSISSDMSLNTWKGLNVTYVYSCGFRTVHSISIKISRNIYELISLLLIIFYLTMLYFLIGPGQFLCGNIIFCSVYTNYITIYL